MLLDLLQLGQLSKLEEGGGKGTSLALHLFQCDKLGEFLEEYPDREAARYLWDQFTVGFRISNEGPQVQTGTANVKLICDLPHVLKKRPQGE